MLGVLEKKLTRVKVSSGHDGLTSSLQLWQPAHDQARLHSSKQVGDSETPTPRGGALDRQWLLGESQFKGCGPGRKPNHTPMEAPTLMGI